YLLLPYGVQFAAAGALLGVVTGGLIGLLVLILPFLRKHAARFKASQPVSQSSSSSPRGGSLSARLFQVAIPVTASRLVGSGSYFLQSIMTVQGLAAAGIATAVATTQYGILQGMAMPILLLPTALTYSLAVALVPSLS